MESGYRHEDRPSTNGRALLRNHDLDFWADQETLARWQTEEVGRGQLGDLIAGLIKAAAIVKELERVRAEEERQRQELARQRMEQERLQRIDAARGRHICELVQLSTKANRRSRSRVPRGRQIGR